MQTGIRQNRKRLFKQEIRRQVVRLCTVQNHKAKIIIIIVSRYQESDMQTKQTRARQNQKQNQRASCTISQ